jgi:di/tricarboxylate transporter
MKRRLALLSILIAMVGMIFIVPAASAQNLDAGRADVPFAFFANHQQLPAGCYQVKLLSSAILSLVNCQTGRMAGVMVHTANGYPTIRQGSLVFGVTGREPRLIQVRFPATNIQSDMSVQPKPEHELAWGATSKTTEIALK